MDQTEEDRLVEIGEGWIESNGPLGAALLLQDLEDLEAKVKRLRKVIREHVYGHHCPRDHEFVSDIDCPCTDCSCRDLCAAISEE